MRKSPELVWVWANALLAHLTGDEVGYQPTIRCPSLSWTPAEWQAYRDFCHAQAQLLQDLAPPA